MRITDGNFLIDGITVFPSLHTMWGKKKAESSLIVVRSCKYGYTRCMENEENVDSLCIADINTIRLL